MKKYIIAGNWKMNTTVDTAAELASGIITKLVDNRTNVGVLFCPPFINIPFVHYILKGTAIMLGAQNCHAEVKGAFTGEVSAEMLCSAGCSHVIIGHSERRKYFHENDEEINNKIKAARRASLTPLLCIGETLEERQSEQTYNILERQIKGGLTGIEVTSELPLIVAYEPVWAIGTGIAATTEQIQSAHGFIREQLIDLYENSGREIPLLYGGSVDSSNCKGIFDLDNVCGALVGGASLKVDAFYEIIASAEEASQK